VSSVGCSKQGIASRSMLLPQERGLEVLGEMVAIKFQRCVRLRYASTLLWTGIENESGWDKLNKVEVRFSRGG
jgi:hypothetical protein